MPDASPLTPSAEPAVADPAALEPRLQPTPAALIGDPSGAPPSPGDDASAAPVRPEPPEPKRVARAVERPALIRPLALSLEVIEPDDTFQLRDVGEVAALATSLARVGQLFAIDVRPRGGSYQVVSGFRRLAALRFLQRGTVLARVHENLSDADAWVFALAQALEARSLSADEITAARERLAARGALTPMLRGLIDAALTVPGSDLEPEGPAPADASQEVDLLELAVDLNERLVGISADLSLVADLWDELDAEPRQALLDQLRYYGDLHAYLARLR